MKQGDMLSPLSEYKNLSNTEFIEALDTDLMSADGEGEGCACGAPPEAGCCHHDTSEHEHHGDVYEVCDDCPAYWPVRKVRI